MMALYFHPRRDEKIGPGAQNIKVTNIGKKKLIYCWLLFERRRVCLFILICKESIFSKKKILAAHSLISSLAIQNSIFIKKKNMKNFSAKFFVWNFELMFILVGYCITKDRVVLDNVSDSLKLDAGSRWQFKYYIPLLFILVQNFFNSWWKWLPIFWFSWRGDA